MRVGGIVVTCNFSSRTSQAVANDTPGRRFKFLSLTRRRSTVIMTAVLLVIHTSAVTNSAKAVHVDPPSWAVQVTGKTRTDTRTRSGSDSARESSDSTTSGSLEAADALDEPYSSPLDPGQLPSPVDAELDGGFSSPIYTVTVAGADSSESARGRRLRTPITNCADGLDSYVSTSS